MFIVYLCLVFIVVPMLTFLLFFFYYSICYLFLRNKKNTILQTKHVVTPCFTNICWHFLACLFIPLRYLLMSTSCYSNEADHSFLLYDLSFSWIAEEILYTSRVMKMVSDFISNVLAGLHFILRALIHPGLVCPGCEEWSSFIKFFPGIRF